MKQYLDAVQEVLEKGTRKENRTGVDTLSTFNVNYEIDLRDGFPLLTTKKISWKNIIVENLWFLSGDPHISILHKHGCKFWDAWADKYGAVPSAYGNFWRWFPVHDAKEGAYTKFHPDPSMRSDPPYYVGWNDQIEWVVDELKRNPMSRRLVVSAWAPGNAQNSKLPPCHALFVLNVQHLPTKIKCPNCGGAGGFVYSKLDPGGERDEPCKRCEGKKFITKGTSPHLCLHLTQRSCDIALGVPYNIAGYALLLELFARFADLPAGIFAHTLVDAHAYTSKPDGSMADMDHVPGLKKQLTRAPRKLPRLKIDPRIKELKDINGLLAADTNTVMDHFVLEGYKPYPAIKFKVAV
jgi:thymidylate synthase